MKQNRRRFFRDTALAAAATSLIEQIHRGAWAAESAPRPCFVSTWPFGKPANDQALKTLTRGGTVLDAIEQGIHIIEADAANTSVGLGGTPNAVGVVQLDACIMDGIGHRAGSVAAIEDVLHPISAARLVMDKTKHVMLVGSDARKFALEHGLEARNLLTEGRRKAWRKWHLEQASDKEEQAPTPADNHDTIALVGVDSKGNMAGGCSTSGLGYKTPGRVGDSPILGSGLYVDNEVGAAGATGVGENVMRYCATFMIVEAMSRGASPTDACVQTIHRIAKKDPRELKDLHINFIALDKFGRHGAAGTNGSFRYAVTSVNGSEVLKPTIVS